MSDVLEPSFSMSAFSAEEVEWESAMWALIAASNELLETPESELGGTMYSTSSTMSLMFYDDVPGGAGHVLQLSKEPVALLERVFMVVDRRTCNESACCYGCLCNYRNQFRQHGLTRGGARRILAGSVRHELYVDRLELTRTLRAGERRNNGRIVE